MEGILTILVGILAYFILVGFPDGKHKNWRFLNPHETAFVIARIDADRGDAEEKEKFNFARFMSHGLDFKIWGFALIFCMILIVSYSFAYFLPIILQLGMGFSVGASQCLVAPPYFAAGILMFTTGWIGDKYKTRAPILLFNSMVALIGLPVMTFSRNVGAQYL